jgi:hypothetical protein
LPQQIFQDVQYYYDNLLERLNLLTLRNSRLQFDAFFLINVFSGIKYRSSVLETVEIRVPTRNIRNLACSHARLATALKLDVFQRKLQFVNVHAFLVTRV